MAEWVKIISRVIHHDKNTVIVEYCLFDDSRTYLKTLMWTTFKYVGMSTSRAVEHSEEVEAYLKAIRYPGVDFDPSKFDERVQQVKQETRNVF